ncbi:MAG: amino acid ABC transporter ATP-binding protein [Desulfovibrio sp.]|jgi:polar amino acid transport system ATP-binding protein|nr:amino acid ABC transporter ATP-binding protein [Desulfovibrio sp.]
MSLVSADGISKNFGDLRVLRDVTLKVDQGEVIAIIGRSGSGKSTFLRILNGLETLDSGVLCIDGSQITGLERDLRFLRLKVGMIFQHFNLFPHLSAGENVMLAPRVVKKLPRDEVRDLAYSMLAKVDLQDKFDVFPDRLSGGQQQRVAIARALAMQPKLLLCDEITSALDPELVGEVLDVVRKLAAEGMTLIMVTHEMRFARDVCDRLVFMHRGRIHEQGPPAELFAAPATQELAVFIGPAA